MSKTLILTFSVVAMLATALDAQVLPPGFGPRAGKPTKKQQQAAPARPAPAPKPPAQAQEAKEPPDQGPQPETAKPAAEGAEGAQTEGTEAGAGASQAETAETAPQSTPSPAPRSPTGALSLQNASLTQVVDALARQLKINYLLDPRVKGGVILNTYGDTSNIDARQLLDLILRINGAAMVQVGDYYRIVPMGDAPRLPIPPEVNPDGIPEDEQIMLSLIFLKYVTVDELVKVIEPFIGEGASTWAYPPANLLLVLDNRRNMKRTMDLIDLFDSNALAKQRVRIFDTEHRRPSELTEELEAVLKSISLNPESSPIRFLPIDRLNLIVAVAPNPGAFEQVEEWLRKLDQPIKVTAGTIDNYVYRVRYRRAEALAAAIMSLYGGMGYGGAYGSQFGLFTGAASGFGNRFTSGPGGFGGGFGGGYGGGVGGGFGGGYGGGYGGGGFGGGYGGFGGGGGYAPGSAFGRSVFSQNAAIPENIASRVASQRDSAGGVELPASFSGGATGSYMGQGGGYGGGYGRIPRVIPNPLDNSLLIQGTPEEYRQILDLLEKLDTPPRQVLIDAKIFEVSLTGAFSAGVSTFLKTQGDSGGPSVGSLKPLGSITSAGLAFSVGAMVDQSRVLLTFLEAKENTTRAKVLAAPSLIATDSIPASINVGTEVPVLTAQAVSPIQSGGSSLFTNSVSNRDSGVTLSVLARVNPSGIVTLVIDQETSAPQAPPVGGIQSPSFSKRTVQTQVTVNDGDTIAIGGIINETETVSSAGLPYLHRIPIIGYAFGGKSKSRERTELVIFITPHVIYDTHQVTDATEELKSRFRKLARELKRLDQ